MDETSESQKSQEAPQKPSFGRRILRWSGELAFVVVGAIVISVILRTFVAQMFVIPSGSMENTLVPGDRVLVAKFGGFQRGDVVVFKDPSDWLNEPAHESNPALKALEFIGVLPNSDTEYLIKRVIGMPGDKVKCCDPHGRVTVNGQALEETSYLYAADGVVVSPAEVPFEIVVPKDHIFVMGDHRNQSKDSRCRFKHMTQGEPEGMAAFVPTKSVVGAAVAILAPLPRLATFHVPETFQHVPDPGGPPPEKPNLVSVSGDC